MPRGIHLHWRRVARRRKAAEELRENAIALGFFNALWYATRYPDVSPHPASAWAHYRDFGWKEGRWPSPYFDPRWYLNEYPDVADAAIEPLTHWLWQGRGENRRPFDPFRADLLEINHWSSEATTQRSKVVVAVPIYGNPSAVRDCLESLLASLSQAPHKVTIHLHDDASKSAEIDRILAKVPASVTTSVSAVNQGFTRSANFLLERYRQDDIVLLNSDTVVFPGWLDALRRAAYSGQRVASATALSNNATIASFPDWPVGRNISPAVGSVIASNIMKQIPDTVCVPVVPTGVGSCIYLRRDAIMDVGMFDEATFSRGYGEENDWSLRASQRGWVNVLATGSYVLHSGGLSFGEEKLSLMTQGRLALERKHPGYESGIARWIGVTPIPNIMAGRAFVEGRIPAMPGFVHVLHDFGGGTLDFVLRQARDSLARVGRGGLVIRVRSGDAEVDIVDLGPGEVVTRFPYFRDSKESLVDWLIQDYGGVRSMQLHDPGSLGPDDLARLRANGWEVSFTVHDVRTICPRDFMVHPTGDPCSGPGMSKCERCLSLDVGPSEGGLAGHLARTRTLVAQVNEVAAPSHASAGLWSSVTGENCDVLLDFGSVCVPGSFYRKGRPSHPVLDSDQNEATARNVLLLGTMVRHKGSRWVRRLVDWCYVERPELQFSLAGSWEDPETEPPTALHVLDRYHGISGLRALIQLKRPDWVVIASPASETYSLLLDDILLTRPPGCGLLLPDTALFRERTFRVSNVDFYSHGAPLATLADKLGKPSAADSL